MLDIQKQSSMEKLCSDLHVKKMEHVGYKMYLKKKNYTSLLSSHPHALQQRQVGLDDDTARSLLVKRSGGEWALLLFFIQHFPFLSDLDIKHNSKANFELFYYPVQSWQNDGDITDDDDIQNYTVNHCYCYSVLDSELGLFDTSRPELDSK